MNPSHPRIYDEIGIGYRDNRIPDPRIRAQIEDALGDARRICNVGAGAGSYEPLDRDVVAVESSRAMIAQRERSVGGRGVLGGRGAVVRGVAESLPFATGSFDAALAVLTIHHWEQVESGLAKLCRIAPRRVVFTFDPDWTGDFWLLRDYFPQLGTFGIAAPSIAQVADAIGASRVDVVPVPADCSDGFQAAYWRRPERYLDPAARVSISSFAQLPEERVEKGLRRLAHDLESGAWHERNAELCRHSEVDFGYRLVVGER